MNVLRRIKNHFIDLLSNFLVNIYIFRIEIEIKIKQVNNGILKITFLYFSYINKKSLEHLFFTNSNIYLGNNILLTIHSKNTINIHI